MLYVHCLVWHKEISSFSIDEDEFKAWLFSFLNQVIRWELTLLDTNKVLLVIEPLAAIAEDKAFSFTLQYKDNANLVVSQVEMHSQNYNASCF